MKAIKKILVHCLVFTCTTAAIPAMSTEIGGGYGKEFRGNSDLDQFEAYVREPLSFKREFDSGLKVSSAAEIGMSVIREAHSENDEAARFSAMPQVIVTPHPNVNCIFGLGAGFMVGNTEFTKHNLGGSFLLASKFGIQFLLGQNWNIGYFYIHQSNAGIYDYNAGLNMHELAFSYTF